MEGDRSWMYGPHYVNKRKNPVFVKGVESFFKYASGIQKNIINGDRIRCPCVKCECTRWFLDDAGPSFDCTYDKSPNQKAQEFYNMMKVADELLWDGFDKEHTVLACVTELFSIKIDCCITNEGFNRIISAVKKWFPKENMLPLNQYQCKKLVKGLGLSHVKIHACPNYCMLYYGDDNISKEKCDVYGRDHFKQGNNLNPTKHLTYKEVRYLPIAPRLLRLFFLLRHKEGQREKDGVMVHPTDGERWNEFNRLHPDFAADARNVYLGFCSDGFSLFNMGVGLTTIDQYL